MLNLQAVLHEGLASFDSVIKVTIYLVDIDDYESVNEVYARFLGDKPPARSLVQVTALPKGALVEIECIATAS